MHSPLAMQALAHFSDSAGPLPSRRMSSTPDTTAFGSASPRPAGAAIGQALKQAPHLVQASSMSSTRRGEGFFESGVLHRIRIAQITTARASVRNAVHDRHFWIAAAALRHHVLRRAVEFGEERVDRRGRRPGVISRSSLAASARNCGSFMVASNAARSAALRSAGMSGEVKNGRPTILPGDQEPQHLALLVARGALERHRHVRQVGILLQIELHQHVDLRQPVLLALEARPRPAAAAVDLAALHREIDVVAARIAGDELDLGAEHVAQDQRERVGIGADRAAAEAELALEHVVPGLDRRGLPGGADAGLAGDAAEPGELGRRRSWRR